MLARTESFFAVDNFPPCIPVTFFILFFFHSIGRLWLVNPSRFHLYRAARAAFSEHVMPIVSHNCGMVGLTAGLRVDLD